MNYKQKIKLIPIVIAAIFFSKIEGSLLATPYASGITNVAGTVSFFLNEPADTVNVILSNGNGGTNFLGALARGKYSFALGTNLTFKIEVTKASGPGWKSADGTGTNAVRLMISATNTPTSPLTNRYLNIEQPRGLKVNKNPSSSYFGRIYAGSTGVANTGAGRTMTRGVYMINPDYSSAHPLGQEDVALTGGLSPSGTSFPYELAIGQDDNLYWCDWTDTTANLWVTDPEITLGSNVLPLFSGTAKVPVGSANTHGSINAAHVEGSLAAGNLSVWTIDEDLQLDPTQTTTNGVNSLWRYDANAGPLPNTDFPTKIWTASGKQGIAFAPQTMDMVRSTNGYFYITTSRASGTESGLAVVDASGTPLWNSFQASTNISGTTDFLTNSQKVAVSPDNKYVAVARSTGFIRILPLVNGIPNMTNRLTLLPFTATSAIRGLCFDAAGNLYVDSNSSEFIAVFSPGGTTVSTTSNDPTGTNGTFGITAPATTVSVTSTVSTLTENGGTNGVFTITRVGDTSVPLTVPYLLSGTATNGTDYNTPVGSVTIAAFQSSTNIFVVPINDGIAETTETVVLSLQGGSGYSVGSPGSATVSILDDEAPEVSVVPSTAKKLLEGYATSKVTHQLIRRGLLTSALTVNLSYSGSATVGVDFGAPASVAITAGTANANVVLTSINDQNYEGDETATVSVAAGSGYSIGASNSISATIIDDETPSGAVLFSDNFETDSSLMWAVNKDNPIDGFVDFAWDYGLNAGIPPAPGSSTTLGMRFRCGNTILIKDAISASPLNGNFTGDYRLKFNMWINYNGVLPDGGPGSTQNFDAGVGTTGDHVVWQETPNADGIWFTTTGDGADGNSGGDYNAFIGSTKQNDDSGFYGAGVGPANGGLRDNGNSYYSYWGGVTAPAAQLALYPGQTGVANAGNAGMAWHSVVITKLADTVTWMIDGITIASVTNDPSGLSTNVFVGYQDIFASGSLSDVPEMSFGLVDNLRVEVYSAAPPATPNITSIQVVGGNVQISFTGDVADVSSAFTLLSSATVDGTYTDAGAVMGGSAGSFTATVAINGTARFYRIKR